MNENIPLKPGSELHNRIRDNILERYRLSHNKMQERSDDWLAADKQFHAYVNPDDKERKSKQEARDGKARLVTVHVPYAYALASTAHTYWSSVLLSRSPVFQYTGRHGESEQQTQYIEALIDYQINVGKMMLPLSVWLMDIAKYGFGVVGGYWTEELSVITQVKEVPVQFQGNDVIGKMKKVKETVVAPAYKGLKIFNVRPHNFLPDPRVPIHRFQDGEFCGCEGSALWLSLKKQESGSYARFMNVDAIPKMDRTRNNITNTFPGDRAVDTNSTFLATNTKDDRGFVSTISMHVFIAPETWGIKGIDNIPQRFQFTLANGDTIIEARPLGQFVDAFPYFVIPYELDGYAHTSRGVLEVAEPLCQVLSWLFNSHMYNVRAMTDGNFIVDPSKILLEDFASGPGRLIRLRPSAFGTDTRSVVTQLQSVDTTQAHIRDFQLVEQLVQRTVGLSDAMMGAVYPGGRKTATEIRTSSSSSINRQKTFTETASYTGWGELAQYMVQMTQQFYDEEQKFKIAGDKLEDARWVQIDPESITGFYDFVPADGSLPVDRFAQANMWKELILGLERLPQVGASYDIAGIFGWVSKLMGINNIDRFKIQAQPQDQIATQVQQGNLVPL